MSITKEERYILKLYEMATKSGAAQNMKDCYKVGEALGFSDKVVNALINILAQANFVKKIDDRGIHLTHRGVELAKRLQQESRS